MIIWISAKKLAGNRKSRAKGAFNVRVTTELHQKLVKHAMTEGVTLNAYIKSILEKAVSENHAGIETPPLSIVRLSTLPKDDQYKTATVSRITVASNLLNSLAA
jgi:hypothetical protein